MERRSHALRPKQQVLDELHRSGVVIVIRASAADGIVETVESLLAGGVRAVEITLTTPGAIDLVRQLAERFSREEILLGAGTVLEADEAEAAIDAGAEFLVSPSIEIDVINECRKQQVVCMPGAFTPTEIRTAMIAGA